MMLVLVPLREIMAQTADSPLLLEPYVEAGIAYDSNLLRQSDDQDIELADKKSDRIYTLQAGVDGKLDISRQEFVMDARIFRKVYDHYDDLDHTGGRGRVAWKWNWAPLWSGDIGYLYDRRLRDFSNQLVALPIRDLRTENRPFASVARSLGGGFTLKAGVRLADVEFEESEGLDIDRHSGKVGLVYETFRNNKIGLEVEFVDGDFKEGDDRDFDETRARATLQWRLSRWNRVDAEFGYAERDHKSSRRTDFDGFTGSLSLVRTSEFGNKLTATVWRDISTFGDEVANYAVVNGIRIEPEWRIGRSLVLRLSGAYEARDYKGFRDIDAPVADLVSRDDDIYSAGIWFDWEATRIIMVSLGYTGEIRDSNRDLAEYEYNYVELRFRLGL